jgi:hypothetical protein
MNRVSYSVFHEGCTLGFVFSPPTVEAVQMEAWSSQGKTLSSFVPSSGKIYMYICSSIIWLYSLLVSKRGGQVFKLS